MFGFYTSTLYQMRMLIRFLFRLSIYYCFRFSFIFNLAMKTRDAVPIINRIKPKGRPVYVYAFPGSPFSEIGIVIASMNTE